MGKDQTELTLRALIPVRITRCVLPTRGAFDRILFTKATNDQRLIDIELVSCTANNKEVVKVQEEMNPRVIEVGLEGIIQFQGDDATLECIVRDITRDYTEVVVITFDQRICVEENVELRVILPTERSPIK